jgi:hypothetical protein
LITLRGGLVSLTQTPFSLFSQQAPNPYSFEHRYAISREQPTFGTSIALLPTAPHNHERPQAAEVRQALVAPENAIAAQSPCEPLN